MQNNDARLANRILIGLVLGAVAGTVVLALGNLLPQLLEGAQWFATTVCDPLGQVFLRMLFFVVIPLVFASLANGVVQLGELAHLGPLAGRTFTLFFLNMPMAATRGLLMMNILQPGTRLDEETSAQLIQEYSGQAAKHVETSATRPQMTPATELAAGYHKADDFEFLRLQNIGPSPIDLAGVRFTTGITFDYTASPLRYRTPGGNVLVVANLGAFQRRYGHGCDAILAGVYGGKIDNNGEGLQLVGTNGVVIRDFTYDDFQPWPEAANGDGPSLVLCEPASNPDHADYASWTASAMPGGMPAGGPVAQTYAAWRALLWDPINATNNLISGPAADFDGDGLSNFLEYAFGTDPLRLSAKPMIQVATEEYAPIRGPQDYPDCQPTNETHPPFPGMRLVQNDRLFLRQPSTLRVNQDPTFANPLREL